MPASGPATGAAGADAEGADGRGVAAPAGLAEAATFPADGLGEGSWVTMQPATRRTLRPTPSQRPGSLERVGPSIDDMLPRVSVHTVNDLGLDSTSGVE